MSSVEVPNRSREPDMERLISTYGNSLLRMCFLYLKDRQLAEDAVQDTYIKVYKNYAGFRGDSSEKTWIVRIAINVCKNYLRNPWKTRINSDAVLADIPCRTEGMLFDDTVLREIMMLSPKYKEVILLFYYQELKIREIAEALHIPESTVTVRLKRAREQLKPKLKGWYYDENQLEDSY